MDHSKKTELAAPVATILLVDDREDNLLVLDEILQPLGQKTVKVTSGEEALKYLFAHDVGVIILDVTMPGMSGFETATFVREREKSRHIPIIFVTGVNPHESLQGYSLGGVDYILKPIAPEILRAKVNVFVELFRKTEEINQQRQALLRKNEELNFEIVERRRAEESLLDLNRTLELRVAEKTEAARRHADELAKSNAELEQFAHIVSHDLQEPIRKIVNFTHMLQETFPNQVDDKAKEYFSYVVDGAKRMKALIQDLLKFSQIGNPDFTLQSVDVNKLLTDILSELEPLIQETGAIITCGNVGSVEANSTQLRQLFQNLIQNAIKFRSKLPPQIQISRREDGDYHLFSIQDNGIGIDPKYKEKIFEIFQRLHTRREYPGSGIGLSICKKIVGRHGGKMWVESQFGSGSTFLFTIPTVAQESKNGPFNEISRERKSQEAKNTALH